MASSEAAHILKTLSPHCLTIEPAGSIRRRADPVHDIEIVAVPKRYNTLIPDQPGDIHAEFLATVERYPGPPVLRSTRYTRRTSPSGIPVDLFFAFPDNFGWILAIRTGPSLFSTKLAIHAERLGLVLTNGHIYKNNTLIPVPDEESLFALLQADYIPPPLRSPNAPIRRAPETT